MNALRYLCSSLTRSQSRNACKRRGFREGKSILDEFAYLQSTRVRPSKKRDQQNRYQLFRGKTDSISAENTDRCDQIPFRRNCGDENAEELRERNRNCGNCSRLNDEEQRPAIQEANRRAVGFSQKNVNAACARHHSREF